MKDILRIILAPLVWLVTFTLVYGLHGLLCGHDLTTAMIGEIPLARVLLVAAYVFSVLVQLALLAALYAPRFASGYSFVRFVSRATGWVGLVATLWTLFPVATTSYCGPAQQAKPPIVHVAEPA